jgi:hypothetical protein
MQKIGDFVALGDAPLNGGIPFGAIEDVYNDCDNLPEPQYPKMKHSLEMAGSKLSFNAGGLGDEI